MTISFCAIGYRWCFTGFMLTLFVAGCASTKNTASPNAKRGFGMEQLLRLPVDKGHAGVDEIVRELQALYGVSPDTQLSPLGNAKASINLEDGTVIDQALTDAPERDEIAIKVADKPCFPVERAAALVGAKKMYEDLGDGIGYVGHIDYSFNNADVRINLVAVNPGQHCLSTVWIYKESL